MIEPRNRVPFYNEHDDDYYPQSIREEIAICTNCDLPCSECNKYHCERYERMIKEIKAKRKLSKDGRLIVKRRVASNDKI